MFNISEKSHAFIKKNKIIMLTMGLRPGGRFSSVFVRQETAAECDSDGFLILIILLSLRIHLLDKHTHTHTQQIFRPITSGSTFSVPVFTIKSSNLNDQIQSFACPYQQIRPIGGYQWLQDLPCYGNNNKRG